MHDKLGVIPSEIFDPVLFQESRKLGVVEHTGSLD